MGGIAIIAIDPILVTSQEESRAPQLSVPDIHTTFDYLEKNLWNEAKKSQYVHNNVFHGWLRR